MSKRAKCPSLGTSLPTHSYLSHSRFLACNCRPDADAKSKVVSVEIQRQVEMDMARTASKDNQNIKAQLADVGMGILLTVTSAILLPVDNDTNILWKQPQEYLAAWAQHEPWQDILEDVVWPPGCGARSGAEATAVDRFDDT